MIKILKSGTKKKVECPECGALLSYDSNGDIQTGYEKRLSSTNMPYKNPYDYIICPQCQYKIVLKKDAWL